MENNENTFTSPDDNEGIFFSDTVVDFMLESAKWARFISIVGFVFAFLIAVFALGISSFLPALNQMAARSGGAAIPAGSLTTFVTIYYLAIAVICFLFYFRLYQYAVNAKKAMYNSSQYETEKAFKQLSGFFKYWGILTIVILVMVIMSVITLAGAGIGMS